MRYSSVNSSDSGLIPSKMCQDCDIRQLPNKPTQFYAQCGVDFLLGMSDPVYEKYIKGEEAAIQLQQEQYLSEEQAAATIACAQMHKYGACVVGLSY